MDPQKEHRLRQLLGLEPTANIPEASGPESWYQTLLRMRRVMPFDAEDGSFPVDHTSLAEELLPLAPQLSGARMEQEVEATNLEYTARYTLHLTHGGRRFSIVFDNRGDYYDVDAVHDLFNAALEAAGCPLRYVNTRIGAVLVPVDGILQAGREGLVPWEESLGLGLFFDQNGKLRDGITDEERMEIDEEIWVSDENLVDRLASGKRRVQVSPA